jgi:hypothetical protein
MSNEVIKLSKQTKTLFAQVIMKILIEKADVYVLLNDLEFMADHENLLHCINPPSVTIEWEDLEDADAPEPEEDFLGIDGGED